MMAGSVAITPSSMPIRRALKAGMGTNAVSAAGKLAGSTIEAPSSAEDRSPRQVFIDSLRSHRLAWISLWALVAMVSSCIFLPYLLPWSATEFDYQLLAAAGPSLRHPFGTDSLGRDEMARVISAGRISLLIGFTVALISAAIGAAVGVCSGYFGGRVESLLMWVVNVLLSVPAFPLLIALSSVATSANGPAAKMLGSVPP
ncbi:MAG: ABC transporter permease, partial [Thermoleophilia bacterium]|nr:ABC transporter permease [Thermoleophilia bacterium]